ncbi:hypothetical protein [Humisphaera borealis]|uniref:Uncharacterized protein n=1 Tax=Humisphaera borealis TaxID=2807512 RepID=A0A7M2WT19_9BACT|nr:hypothetical protein [Humisphaera borealis]QOV88606.1 hypothetical protein IPV69_20545 [Humisphaera borealis]
MAAMVNPFCTAWFSVEAGGTSLRAAGMSDARRNIATYPPNTPFIGEANFPSLRDYRAKNEKC